MSRSLLLAFLLASSIGACKHRDGLAEFEALTNKICACSTKTCSDAVLLEFERLDRWSREIFMSNEPRPQAIARRFLECAERFPAADTADTAPEPTDGGTAPDDSSACGKEPCPLAVPTGIKGLGFGMSPDDVARALGLAPSKRLALSPRRVPPTESYPERMAGQNPQQHARLLTGKSVEVTTIVGKRPATCTLDFDVDDHLVGIFCELARTDASLAQRFFDGLRESLSRKYGVPDSLPGRLQWRSSLAVLECGYTEDAILLSNYSVAHGARIADTIRSANDEVRRAIRTFDEERARAAAAEQKLLDEQLRALEEDISPAVEQLPASGR